MYITKEDLKWALVEALKEIEKDKLEKEADKRLEKLDELLLRHSMPLYGVIV